MKIVINKCFGGFSLSHEAVMRYAEIKGFTLYAFVDGRKDDGRLDFNTKVPYIGQQDAFIIHYSTKPLKNGTYEEDSYFGDRDIERTDSALIQVVEELGDKANGRCASLAIIEIPDGIEYQIEEYDGQEWVAEKHQTWS